MSSVKKNFAYNSAYQILIMILPLMTAPYIARVIGAEGIGIYSFTYSIAFYFSMFIILGLNNYGNRSIAMVRDDPEKLSKTFWNIYATQFMMAVLVIAFYCIYLFCFVNPAYFTITAIQAIFLLAYAFDINWFFFGVEQFKLTVTRNAIIKLITVVCTFIFVKSSEDLWLYTLILALGMFFSNLILWLFLKRYIYFSKPEWKEMKSHIKPNLVLFIPVIAISLYKVMDKIMLGAMSSMTQTGFYENSEKIINIPQGIITALGTVMLPRMSNLAAKGDKKNSQRYMNLSMEMVMLLACALCFGIAGIAPIFAPIFFGEAFRVCGELISYLSIIILFLSWANVIRTQYLIPQCQDREYIASVFLGAVVNLIINLTLIPKYGAFGAVVGTIFAEAAVALYQTVIVRKELPIGKYFVNSIYFLFIGIAMFGIIRFIGVKLGESIFTICIEIIAGGAFYLICTFVYFIKRKNPVVLNILKQFKFFKN